MVGIKSRERNNRINGTYNQAQRGYFGIELKSREGLPVLRNHSFKLISVCFRWVQWVKRTNVMMSRPARPQWMFIYKYASMFWQNVQRLFSCSLKENNVSCPQSIWDREWPLEVLNFFCGLTIDQGDCGYDRAWNSRDLKIKFWKKPRKV